MDYNLYSNCAHSFGAELYRGCADGYMNIAIFDPAGTKRFFSIPVDQTKTPALTDAVTPLLNANVFFQVNPITTAIGGHSRGSLKDVASVPAFFADIDFKNPGKKEDRLPVNDVEALKMFASGGFLPPTIIVETGRGLHAYWILEEPVGIDSAQTRADMVDVAAAFGSAFRTFALETFDWKFDSTSDLPRLGRLPGTFNVKGETPLPVRWRTDPDSRRYPLQTIVDEIVRFGVPIGKPQKPARTASTGVSVTTGDTAAAWDLIRSIEWAKQDLKKGERPKENFAAVAEGCGWMRDVVENAESTGYNDWFHALGVIGRCHGGERLAHAISAPYPKYTPFETDQKLGEALKADGPVTCAFVERGLNAPACKTCPFRQSAEPITTPLTLGADGRKSNNVLALKRYILSVTEGRFFDLEATEPGIVARGLTKESFDDRHAHERGFLSADMMIADGLLRKADARRFDPSRPSGFSNLGASPILNTYRAPTVVPKAGDASAFLELLQRVFGEEGWRHALAYLAHLYQRPGIKIAHALMVLSDQGLGKGSLFELLSHVFGKGNCHMVEGDHADHRFRMQLGDRVLLGMNEVQSEDRVGFYNSIKMVLADEDFLAEEKGMPFRNMDTPRGVVIFSNKAVPMKIEDSDRRLFVVRRLSVPTMPDNYFRRFWEPSEDFVAAVAHLLSTTDLSGFFAKSGPPMTAAKTELIESSRSRLETAVRDAVEARDGPFRLEIAGHRWLWAWATAIAPGVTQSSLLEALRKAGVEPLPDRGQQRTNLHVYGEKQRFWIVRNHESWRSKTSVQVRDHYQSLCLANHEPQYIGTAPHQGSSR
ncbi:MAG TPA: primase-helicase family protein [Vitreimonas sp.]|uniref:primase-helicase family protein n=1 Tax=Vitreimonas sp. TaxID=3069702 RepID=UPI002D5F8D47|nr:primase-helicase family protein [Vitreimonas sp.]HYD86232.1 primase-helicase family protein [Vitreimonas sp.]